MSGKFCTQHLNFQGDPMTSLLNAMDMELLELALRSLPEEWQEEGKALWSKLQTGIAKGELLVPEPVQPNYPRCTCERAFHMSFFAKGD